MVGYILVSLMCLHDLLERLSLFPAVERKKQKTGTSENKMPNMCFAIYVEVERETCNFNSHFSSCSFMLEMIDFMEKTRGMRKKSGDS